MKEFITYTALRIAVFFAAVCVTIGVWALLNDGEFHPLWAFVIAFLLSGIASYFLLRGPREAFARRVEARAAAMTQRFEEMKAKEDE